MYKNKFVIVATIIFSIINFWNLSKGKPVFDDYDTPSYFELSLYPSFRMQIVTLIYSTLGSHYLIIGFQVLFSVLAFIYLATQIKKLVESKVIGYTSVVLIYILASSSVVTEQNFILRSESLNNSAFIFLFGTLFGYTRHRNFSNFSKVLLAIVILAGTRAVSSLSGLIFLILFFILFNRQKMLERKYLLMGIGAIALNVFFVFTATSTETSRIYTTSSIINERLWVNPVWRNEVINGGYSIQSRYVWEESRNANTGLPPDQAVIDSVQFKQWWDKGNENFLYEFMVRNLDYTLIGPACLPCLYDEFTFRQTIFSGWSQGTDEVRNNISLQNVLTTKTFFWPERPEYAYFVVLIFFLLLIVICIMIIWRFNQENIDILKIISLFLIYILSYSYVSWWLGSKENDMTRHQLNSAIGIRVLIIFVAILITDQLIKKVRPKP